MPDTPESRLRVAETEIEAFHIRLDRIEDKVDTLILSEAERKADDRALKRYVQYGFWGLVSLGGFINWDKIVHAFDGVK